MNGKRRLDHPGTERPPHTCPFPDVHNRLNDAHYLWHEAQVYYFSPPRFRTNLNALIQSLRTVTWVLQNTKNAIPDFDNWYYQWQERMRSDQILKWLVEVRNRIEKQGDLEKRSILRVSLVISHSDEFYNDFMESPSLKTSEILRRLDFSRVPEELLREGYLRLERRWVAADLPGSEILDALAHAYGFLADVVDDAHAQVGLPVPFLVTPQADGSYVPFRGSTIHLQGRLPCMVASKSYRELWIDLKSGGRAEFTTKRYKLTDRKIRKIKRRYDMSIVSPDDGATPKTLEKWAWYFWRIARHMFERDGGHVHIAFLLHDNALLNMRGMQASTHGDLFPLYRDLANEVARTGATQVIVIGELWTAPFDPANPFRRAELSPERGEALKLSAVSADGKQISLFAEVRRTKGRAELGETEVNRRGMDRSLAPVIAAWRHR